MRKGQVKHIATGKKLGKRDKERQQEKILDSLVKWNGKRSITDLITSTMNR
jgi:hypothetical protein